MLTSLHIKNFKGINLQGVDLEELGQINYLVGENGCGKSSVLEGIQHFYLFEKYIKVSNIPNNPECRIVRFTQKSNKNEGEPKTGTSQIWKPAYWKTQGFINICTNEYNLTILNNNESFSFNSNHKHTSFNPFLIHCDGIASVSSRYKTVAQNIFNLGLNKTDSQKEDYLEAVKQLASEKNEINLSDLSLCLNSLENNSSDKSTSYQKIKDKVTEYLQNISKQNSNLSSSFKETNGLQIIFNLALGIVFLNIFNNIDIFLLEEPENHLYPMWQKKLPEIFDFLTQELGVQFFISTHSPFIISSSSQVINQSKPKRYKLGKELEPNQKVYFLKNGTVADKHGNITVDQNDKLKGRFGYWGSKCNYVASKMLGAGLMDLISPQISIASSNAPVVIFCEGQGNDEDARIYNIIFKDLYPPVLFISARGSSQLYKTFQIVSEIKKGLSGNFELKMVRDRDHEFGTINDIINYEKTNKGLKVLFKRAIECYLFNSETATLLLNSQGLHPDKQDLDSMNVLQNQIQYETEQCILGDSYKLRLREAFLTIISPLIETDFVIDLNFKEKIATLITPKTETYKELFEIIFG